MKQIPYGKNIVIKEQSFEQFKEESAERLEQALKGQETDTVVSFDNPEKIRSLLTEKRLELMKQIMEEEPESITEMAENLERDMKEVHNDLKLLEDNKIVFSRKMVGKRNQ